MTYGSQTKCHRYTMLTIYTAFLIAYSIGALSFFSSFHNPWAGMGFVVVSILIVMRIYMHMVSCERLMELFYPRGLTRVFYQLTMICIVFISLALCGYLLAQGFMRHQAWTGQSYFCSFIGWLMAAKWACFDMYAMYRLRYDVIYDDIFYDSKIYSLENPKPHPTTTI